MMRSVNDCPLSLESRQRKLYRHIATLSDISMGCRDILHHWGIQLIFAYSLARPAVLVAGKGRVECFYFFCFITFIPVSLSSLSLSFISLTISPISLLPFSER